MHPDIFEQLIGRDRSELLLIEIIMEIIDDLYWDELKNQPKVGAQDSDNHPMPGSLRRFVGTAHLLEVSKHS